MSKKIDPSVAVPNVKCRDSSCQYLVAGKSGHDLCNRHRECNNKGYYDPNRCNVCRSLYALASDPTNPNPRSKSTLAYIHKTMRKSTALLSPMIWAEPDFKILYHDPVFATRGAQASRSKPSNGSRSKSTSHSTSPPPMDQGVPHPNPASGLPPLDPPIDSQDMEIDQDEILSSLGTTPRNDKKLCKGFPVLKAMIKEVLEEQVGKFFMVKDSDPSSYVPPQQATSLPGNSGS